MKYDFTSRLNRKGHDALALDVLPYNNITIKDGFSILPMWVADMNFPVFPNIQKAMIERIHEPHYGYFRLPQKYFDAIHYWQKERNNVTDLKDEMIGYENGVLGCVSSAIQTFTCPGESILVHSPTYIGFSHVFDATGRKAIDSPLYIDNQGVWRMDYEDMDRKLKENNIHFAIFCSPHNPTGRVWEKEEIEKAMDIYKNNDCIVISDEIWSDIINPNYKHTPTQSISEDAKHRTIAIYAPSKTFNLAGLVGSYHIIYNKTIRDKMMRYTNISHYNSPNILSIYALLGAYNQEGQIWVDELCQTISDNVNFAYAFIKENFKGVSVSYPQGTYMLYLDCSEYRKSNNISMDDLLRKGVEVGVIWQDGRPFKKDNTIRMNLALPTDLVMEAFERLKEHVF